jgi:hypothetical protein
MYIPELDQLKELVDNLTINVHNNAHVIAIAELRVKLRAILDTFNHTQFIPNSHDKYQELLNDIQITDEIIHTFGPYMTMYLLQRTIKNEMSNKNTL